MYKFKITAKEADETNYWFRLCKASSHFPDPHLRTFAEVEYK
ncbi:hypothetical protein LZ575_15430 [Antarcticibacterium sp. 1MA-6-2]|nr:hypothetical protein [Antarcticibacterium sp. 1MA-6-2]UJH93009.1 hypothetical protein LZ575_15430 [Antarcticibacterium sp. 1MA-6-2]